MQFTAYSPIVYDASETPEHVVAHLKRQGFVVVPHTRLEYARLYLPPRTPVVGWNAVLVVHPHGAIHLNGSPDGITAMQSLLHTASVNDSRRMA